MIDTIEIADSQIALGQKCKLTLPIEKLNENARDAISVDVLRGQIHGPTLVICADVSHAQVESATIIHSLLNIKSFQLNAGTLITLSIAKDGEKILSDVLSKL